MSRIGKWVTGKSNLVERGHKKCPTGNLNGLLLTQKLLRLFLCDNLVTKRGQGFVGESWGGKGLGMY